MERPPEIAIFGADGLGFPHLSSRGEKGVKDAPEHTQNRSGHRSPADEIVLEPLFYQVLDR